MTDEKATQRGRRVAIRKLKYLLLMAVSALVSCDGTVYQSFKQVSCSSWSPKDTVSFLYEGVSKPGSDGTTLNMTALVRYNADYKYKNLIMRVETIRMADTLLLSVDTLHCQIYDDSGYRLGSTAGSLYQNVSNDVFVEASPSDTLMLRLSHIMSDESLAGVCDVGLRLTSEK